MAIWKYWITSICKSPAGHTGHHNQQFYEFGDCSIRVSEYCHHGVCYYTEHFKNTCKQKHIAQTIGTNKLPLIMNHVLEVKYVRLVAV